MGTVYCGPYADQINANAYHEGYAARILPNGTETGTWTHETREFRNYVARCDCGWRGTAVYPPTEHGEELALEEWDWDHLQPLINAEADRHTIPARVLLAFARELREEASRRHDASVDHPMSEAERERVIDKNKQRAHGMWDAADALSRLLDDLAQQGGHQ